MDLYDWPDEEGDDDSMTVRSGNVRSVLRTASGRERPAMFRPR